MVTPVATLSSGSEPDITLRPGAGSAIRCAYCHAPLANAEPSWRCGACAALLHEDCHHEAGHCPTPGCAASVWAVARRFRAGEA